VIGPNENKIESAVYTLMIVTIGSDCHGRELFIMNLDSERHILQFSKIRSD